MNFVPVLLPPQRKTAKSKLKARTKFVLARTGRGGIGVVECWSYGVTQETDFP
jgi:hypothetical protein